MDCVTHQGTKLGSLARNPLHSSLVIDRGSEGQSSPRSYVRRIYIFFGDSSFSMVFLAPGAHNEPKIH
jgi:hypothetical protein